MIDLQKMCGSKARYDNRQLARKAMNGLTKTQIDLALPMVVYPCYNCDGWHVGHRAQNRKHKATLDAFRKNGGIRRVQ